MKKICEILSRLTGEEVDEAAVMQVLAVYAMLAAVLTLAVWRSHERVNINSLQKKRAVPPLAAP